VQDTQDRRVAESRLEGLLSAASAFFESHLWEQETSEKARAALSAEGLDEKVIRAFGVGYAPVGHDKLLEHLQELGYSTDEVVASGLARVSARGRIHAHFVSRIMFPIRDRDGRILGFAGLGTHLGPSWPKWVVSPDVGLYQRSDAVFGLDRAAKQIAGTKTAVVVGDCVAVLSAHQDGQPNAVTVHTGGVTTEQIDQMATGISGGPDALELDLYGVRIESESEAAPDRDTGPTPVVRREPPPHLELKRMLLVTATALVGINTFTGAPLLAIWVGSHAQGGRVLSLRGVLTVLVVLTIVEFFLGLALTWLSAKYDRLTGRPRFAGETSPWQRAKRGDRVQDIRTRFGMSAPERVVAACVVLGFLFFEVWFFFLAGSSLPHQ
jgi:DNA primase catalytic core, N-terminal domain